MKTLRTTILLCAVCVAGCEDPPKPTAPTGTATQASTAKPTATVALTAKPLPEPTAAPVEEVQTVADFEDEAASEILPANFEATLDGLEKEVDSP